MIESRREQAKRERRQRILAAAESLIEETAGTDFSMALLAKRAGISTYTTYNLIGQKSSVLYSLLNQSLDELDLLSEGEPPSDDAVEYVFYAAENIVQLFTSRENLYRPLFSYLLSSNDPEHRPAFMMRSISYWSKAYEPLAVSGYIRDPIKTVDLIRDAQMFFTGVLEYWVHGDLSNKDFFNHVGHGFVLRMLSLGISATDRRLLYRLRKGQENIMKLIG